MPMIRTLVKDVQRAAPKIVSQPMGRIDLLGEALSSYRRTASGKVVTDDQSLTITAVYRAVAIRANLASSLPIHVYEKRADGSREQVMDDAESFIWDEPNPEVNRYVFWNTVFVHLVLTNNAFLYPWPRLKDGGPQQLWPIEPRRMKVGRASSGDKVYLLDGTTTLTDYGAGGDIIHIQGFGTDGLVGLSPIKLFAQSMGLSLAAEEFAGRVFGSGSLPGGYLSTDQAVNGTQAQEIVEMWEERHQGPENSNRVALLGRGTKWNHTSINPDDMQLLESRTYQVSDVARMFGVPAHLLSDHVKQTSYGAGIAEQNRGLLTYTVDPDLINVELTVSGKLLRRGRYMKFERGALLRGSPKELAETLAIERQNGIINADEWRELTDRPPLPGGAGQEYFNPNITPGAAGQPTAKVEA